MNDEIKNGEAVIKEEEKAAKTLVTQTKDFVWKHKWKILRVCAKEVYRNWDVIEPNLVILMEAIKSLF